MATDDQIIFDLEQFWENSGFFGRIRSGIFDEDCAERVIDFLTNLQLTGTHINMRIVSLIWYVPLFLEWNRERVVNAGGSDAEYRAAATRIQSAIQSILGLP